MWRTRDGDEATIVYLYASGNVEAYLREENDSIKFDQAGKRMDSDNDELVEYLRETDRPRLEVGKKYRTESDAVVKIIENDGTSVPFQADNGSWYLKFGFNCDDPIVALVEEAPTQANQPADDRYKEVLRIAVGHVVGDKAFGDLNGRRETLIECKEELEESIRSTQAELAEYQATLAAFDVILQAQTNPDAFATPDKASELFAAIDRLKAKEDEVAA